MTTTLPPTLLYLLAVAVMADQELTCVGFTSELLNTIFPPVCVYVNNKEMRTYFA